MADDQIHKQEFSIRNLSTSHVTLYPTKAQVVRDIKNVSLRPGANEITLVGFSPTVQESSIKVEGFGGSGASAVITDMMVDLVPNLEQYEDVYPDEDDDEGPPAPYTRKIPASNEEIDGLSHDLAHVDQELTQLREELASAGGQLSILDYYKNSVQGHAPGDVTRFIEKYREERHKVSVLQQDIHRRITEKGKQREDINNKHAQATHALRMQTYKADKQKELEAKKKERARKEKADAKLRLKEQRGQFWPKKVYRVIISLDAGFDTPMSSRRGSVDSLSAIKQESTSGDASEISLSVSYVTDSASWAPRYDLSLHTSSATGTIMYRAEYYNATSETWKDAKISLSTSEAAFQGLGRPIPLMMPWHIKLTGGTHGGVSEVLMSGQEHGFRADAHAGDQAKASEPRSSLFGLPTLGNGQDPDYATTEESYQYKRPMPAQEMQQQQQVQRHGHGSGIPRDRGAVFGSSAPTVSRSVKKLMAPAPGGPAALAETDAVKPDFYSADTLPDLPSLATEEATWAEEGLTFTYDVGTRTITPSFTKRRYRIVSVQVKNVHLSHLLVPKLQRAAFLKARIPNSSSISLLRGMAGVTLDGSFLGNTTIPRCSAGDSFSLSLGIDPSVNVIYGKPVMRRMKEGGLFFSQKEGSCTFTRTCTITNTKSKRPIEGLMLDQVPVSDDERLKVWILRPSDLNGEGLSTSDGEGVTRDGRRDPKWGKARAVVKPKGEICWDFKIEPQRGVKFVLEYETRYPGDKFVIAA